MDEWQANWCKWCGKWPRLPGRAARAALLRYLLPTRRLVLLFGCAICEQAVPLLVESRLAGMIHLTRLWADRRIRKWQWKQDMSEVMMTCGKPERHTCEQTRMASMGAASAIYYGLSAASWWSIDEACDRIRSAWFWWKTRSIGLPRYSPGSSECEVTIHQSALLASFRPLPLPNHLRTPVAIKLAEDCYERPDLTPMLYDLLEQEGGDVSHYRPSPLCRGNYVLDWVLGK